MIEPFETNVDISGRCRTIMADYVPLMGAGTQAFRGDVHVNDEMFFDTVARVLPRDVAYFKSIESGKRTMDVVRQLCERLLGGFATGITILDFACGYGRLTRHLLREVPASQVTCSDIDPEAVGYQRDYFGVETLQSTDDPDAFSCDRRFDLIVACSLFTHLPDPLFKAWLARLGGLLSERGVLCFSVGDARINVGANRIGDFDEEGILFTPSSESRNLPGSIYGRTIVTEGYVRRAVRTRLPGAFVARKFRSAMYEYQDVYVVTRNPAVNDLRLTITPLGGINGATFDGDEPNTLTVYGWAIDLNRSSEIASVTYHIGEQTVGRSDVVGGDPDILQFFPGEDKQPVQWTSPIQYPHWRDDTILRCRIHSSSGAMLDCYVDVPAR